MPSPTISGSRRSDTLFGTQDDDLILALAGNDRVFARGGDDVVEGGEGNDRLRGGKGNDELLGGPGQDWLFGGAGDDALAGGRGNDRLDGGPGSDTAIFSGLLLDYAIEAKDDFITVRDLRRGPSGEGNDRLEGVEFLRFGDGSVIAAPGTGPNPVLEWNQIALEAIRVGAANPLVASRALAIESCAMFDVLAAIDGSLPWLVALDAPKHVSAEAAVAAAAHRVLTALFPAQAATLDAELAESLARIADGAAENKGVAFGQAVADAILAVRNGDGSNAVVAFAGSGEAGIWRSTPPGFAAALAPHWGDVTPFALASGDQFRPPVPPDLASADYATAFEEVKRLGSATSAERTADQTEIARFWADGPATYTPPGHWNAIATQIAGDDGLGMAASARVLAMLNLALADAGIAAWDCKYSFIFWRPVTAIREAGSDGNDATVADTGWTPLIGTPPFPEYVSGHSTFSAAAATILTEIFGEVGFSTSSIGLPGVSRAFDNFVEAALEAGQSRIYGGIHFQFGNQAGLATGQQIGDLVIDAFGIHQDTRAPFIIIDQDDGLVATDDLVLTGFALDNRLGLDELLVRLDGGAFEEIRIDDLGRFSLDVEKIFGDLDDGSHELTFRATDAAGNESEPLSFEFEIGGAAASRSLSPAGGAGDAAAGFRLLPAFAPFDAIDELLMLVPSHGDRLIPGHDFPH